MRPQSIVNFERCYLGAIALGVVNNVLNWQNAQEQVRAAGAGVLPSWYLPVTLVVGIAISLLLWYFTAKRASTVAKWILTVIVALGVLGSAFAFVSGTAPKGLAGIVAIVVMVLQVVAVYLLFRSDAKRWFDGKGDLENTFR